jgi:type II secretory pathway component PulK
MRKRFCKTVSRPLVAPLRSRSEPKRGIAVVAILVVFAVSLLFFGLWSRSIIRERRSLSNQQFRIQAERLAEAGIERGIAARKANANYAEETWSVPAAQLNKTHAAQVRIHVIPASKSGSIRYEATAEFPVGALHRAQMTKSVEIPASDPMKKS